MLSTNFASVPSNIDQAYCMFNQLTLKMECLENINLRYVNQNCANPIQIGYLKSVKDDAKCMSFGYPWEGGDDGAGEARFEYCNENLEQNVVFCDDGSLRTVADDSQCLSAPEEGSWDVKTESCSFGADGSITPRQLWTWNEDTATEYTNNLTGETHTAKFLTNGLPRSYTSSDGTVTTYDQCIDTYSGSYTSMSMCYIEDYWGEDSQ